LASEKFLELGVAVDCGDSEDGSDDLVLTDAYSFALVLYHAVQDASPLLDGEPDDWLKRQLDVLRRLDLLHA